MLSRPFYCRTAPTHPPPPSIDTVCTNRTLRGLILSPLFIGIKQQRLKRDRPQKLRRCTRFTTNAALVTPGRLARNGSVKIDSMDQKPFILGVAGGTASGKTSVCSKIAQGLKGEDSFVLIAQDSFYRDLTPAEASNVASFNFDHPDAFAWDEMVACLQALKAGQGVNIPSYDYKTNARRSETDRIEGADVILFDGILAFHNPELTSLMDLKIYVDVDADTRLARRIRRDIIQRGRDVIQVLDQYERTVKPSHEAFIMPTKAKADVIIPRGAENQAAIDLILQLLKSKLPCSDQ